MSTAPHVDWTTICWEATARAVDAYLASRPVVEHYLYFRPAQLGEQIGGLVFAPECPGPDWQLADPRAERGFTERRVLVARTVEIVRCLPILGV